MRRPTPYLQRRGDTFTFRIAVPVDLRGKIGTREITKAIGTPERRLAIPIALSFAAQAKQLFIMLRSGMGNDQGGNEPLRVGFEFEFELDEFMRPKVRAKGEPHEQSAMQALIQTAIESAAKAFKAGAETSPHAKQHAFSAPSSAPMLSAVVCGGPAFSDSRLS